MTNSDLVALHEAGTCISVGRQTPGDLSLHLRRDSINGTYPPAYTPTYLKGPSRRSEPDAASVKVSHCMIILARSM